MNITLRKANAIQNSISEAIRNIKLVGVLDINEFQDPGVELQKRNAEFFEADKRRADLLKATYQIRGLVGGANATSGVDAKLTQAAYIDKRISQLETITQGEEMVELAVIEGKLDKIRNRKEDSRASIYGREDTVHTGVLTKDQIASAKAMVLELKKQKQKLNDEVLELNVRTEITLSDDVVATLQAEGLL